jgi:hypothetical protein
VDIEREITAEEIAEEEDATPRAPSIENAEQAPEGAAGDPGTDSPAEPGRKGNDPSVRQAGM